MGIAPAPGLRSEQEFAPPTAPAFSSQSNLLPLSLFFMKVVKSFASVFGLFATTRSSFFADDFSLPPSSSKLLDFLDLVLWFPTCSSPSSPLLLFSSLPSLPPPDPDLVADDCRLPILDQVVNFPADDPVDVVCSCCSEESDWSAVAAGIVVGMGLFPSGTVSLRISNSNKAAYDVSGSLQKLFFFGGRKGSGIILD